MKKITLLFLLFSVFGFSQSIVIGAGTGSTSGTGNDPIDGYYEAMRYQVVYTAAELSATLTPYDEITGLGFSIDEDYAGGSLLGYTIKMGHTSATNSAAHDASLTSVVKTAFDYDPTLTVAGAFDMINFDSNFVWNGVDNVLVEVCTDGANAYVSPYGGVRVTTLTNGSRFYRVDSGVACGNNTTTTNGNRPNIQFNYIDGTPPSCLAPNALGASSIASNSASLSWNENGTATAWNIEWGVSPLTLGGGTTVMGVSNPHALGSLAANTTYQYYVQSDCGGSQSTWSGPFTFTTTCNAFSVPFTEGFNSTSTTEACWTVLNVNADTDLWNTNYASNPFEGDQSAAMYTDGNTGANDDWLITPALTLTGNQRLKFQYRVQSATEPNDFELLLSTTGVSPASFTNVLVANTSYSNITYVEQIVDLSAYSGDVNIAWHIPSGGLDGWRLYIDNVIVEDIPSCVEPTTLAVANVSATSVDLSWVDPTGIQADFQYVIQTPGAVPTGAGTQISATSVTGETLDFSGAPLTANTAYEYYVRAECTFSSFSTWAGPFPFRTLCSTFTAPFNEPFATAVLPSCWSQGGATPWEYGSATGTTPVGFAAYGASTVADHTAAGGTFIGMDGSDNDNAEVSTLTSPLIDITPLTTPRLKYAVFSNNTNDAARNTLDVEVYDGAAWNTVNSITDNLGTGWVDFTTDLSTLTITGDIQIRFTITGVSNGGFTFYNDILIDDVIVEETPTCAEPTNLTVSNITSTTANLAWTATTGNYEYVLDMVATNPAGSGTALAGEAYNATMLTPSTTYYFHVRSDCGSTWSTVSFTTPATPPVNDNCATPTVLTPGGVFATNAVVGTNVAATASGETAPGCANYLGGDVWYSAIVPASGTLTFEVNTNSGGLTDTAGAVYSGICGALVLIECDDFDSAAGDDHPLISVTSTPGEVLYFSVWEYGNDNFGTFQVSAYDASLSSSSFDTNSFVAYPNPVKDILNLEYNSEISSVRVMNLLGQEVISRNINANSTQVDMSQLSAGAYIVNVTIGDAVKTIKVVKQ